MTFSFDKNTAQRKIERRIRKKQQQHFHNWKHVTDLIYETIAMHQSHSFKQTHTHTHIVSCDISIK